MINAGKTKLVTIAAISAIIAACGDAGGGSIYSDVQVWRTANSAEKEYPNLPPFEARKKFVRDKFAEASANMKTDDQRRTLAASIYLGFSLVNGRAIPAYCEEMNLDASAFGRQFRSMNRAEERALEAVLEAKGATIDEAWERNKSFARAAAKRDLMSGGPLVGSYEVCKKLKEQPHLFLANASFARHFPQIAATLRSAPATASL